MSTPVRQAAQAIALAGNLSLWRIDGILLACILMASAALTSGLAERLK